MTTAETVAGSSAEVDAEQQRLMDEQCILVDRDDRAVGQASKRVCHQMVNISSGMLHRAFSVFLFNSRGELLLQQRAGCKITFPLHWTNTCCSHPLHSSSLPGAGEEEETDALGVKRAAVRKLQHELGIDGDVTVGSLHWLTKIHYCAASDGLWGEHEIDWILFAQSDLPITAPASSALPFSPNEVEAVRWVSRDELREMLRQWKEGRLLLTPWFALIAEQLLFGWWQRLQDVIAAGGIGEQQRQIIHRLNEKQQQGAAGDELKS